MGSIEEGYVPQWKTSEPASEAPVRVQPVGSACPRCGKQGRYIRDRGFADGSGHVWMCNNGKCSAHLLYYYGLPPNTELRRGAKD